MDYCHIAPEQPHKIVQQSLKFKKKTKKNHILKKIFCETEVR